jgi:hypothetical protein
VHTCEACRGLVSVEPPHVAVDRAHHVVDATRLQDARLLRLGVIEQGKAEAGIGSAVGFRKAKEAGWPEAGHS